MQDVTEPMLAFKEAARHVWNSHFRHAANPMDPELLEAFDEVERGLFRGIVMAPLGQARLADQLRQQALPWLTIRPREDECALQIMFGETDANGNVTWGLTETVETTPSDAFEFFDFFGWDMYGATDLPYVRVRTRDLAAKPAMVGKRALVEQRCCRFLFAPSQ